MQASMSISGKRAESWEWADMRSLERRHSVFLYAFSSGSNRVLISGSIALGEVVGAYRRMGLPSLSTRNLVKFHLIMEPRKPPCLFLRYFHNKSASSPITYCRYGSNMRPLDNKQRQQQKRHTVDVHFGIHVKFDVVLLGKLLDVNIAARFLE